MTDVVTLQLPRDREFHGVAHLVLGGLAARLDLTYDVLEDMTTAIDELLERRDPEEELTLSLEIEERAILAVVGPFDGSIDAELHASDEGLGLRRVLETVVDHVDVGEREGRHWVELRKRLDGQG